MHRNIKHSCLAAAHPYNGMKGSIYMVLEYMDCDLRSLMKSSKVRMESRQVGAPPVTIPMDLFGEGKPCELAKTGALRSRIEHLSFAGKIVHAPVPTRTGILPWARCAPSRPDNGKSVG